MAKSNRICIIDGCGKPWRARGWCKGHYMRWLNHGDPLGGRPTMNGEPQRFFEEVVLTYEGDDCLTWPYARNASGYGHMVVDGCTKYVSRLICEKKHGAPPTPEHDAAHSCGKGHEGCCAKMHLSWKTRAENAADCIIHGTTNRGERSAFAKLTADEVRQIRTLRETMTGCSIATKFGISEQHVCRIHLRIDWAWLD